MAEQKEGIPGREELYRLVWSIPMRQLAKRYGLSDRGLAKICKGLEVPVPGVGYWAKVAAGQSVNREPLKAYSQIKSSDSMVPVVDVPEVPQLSDMHPLVRTLYHDIAKQAAKGPSPGEQDLRPVFWPEAFGRGLRILSGLIEVLESNSRTVSVSYDYRFGSMLAFYIDVSVDKENLRLQLDDRPPRSRRSLLSREFTLAIQNLWAHSTRWLLRSRPTVTTHWRDTSLCRLEDVLLEVVGTISDIERIYKKERKEVEARKREESITKEKQDFLRKLEVQVECWQRAENIRLYLAAVEAEVKNGKLKEDNGLKSWISSGKSLADQLDPITGNWSESPPAFSDLKKERSGHLFVAPRQAPWWCAKHIRGWK